MKLVIRLGMVLGYFFFTKYLLSVLRRKRASQSEGREAEKNEDPAVGIGRAETNPGFYLLQQTRVGPGRERTLDWKYWYHNFCSFIKINFFFKLKKGWLGDFFLCTILL